MNKLTILIIGILFPLFLCAQPFDKAPATAKKIKNITEWIRPNLNATSVKGMVSAFDKNGNLLSYTGDFEHSIFNTYHILDKKGRIVETLEGKGVNRYKTRYFYKKNQKTVEKIFRGKMTRENYYYDKYNKITEFKSFSKGLELGKKFQVKERIIYKYNSRGQCISEKIMTYKMPNSKKFDTRKKIYYYHSSTRHLIKTIEYDYDGKPSVVADYAYFKSSSDTKGIKAPVKSIITNFLKDDQVSTEEFKYQKGKIWQKILTERGFRHVEVYTKGRLIRLRSYNNDKLFRVVDYQYGYY